MGNKKPHTDVKGFFSSLLCYKRFQLILYSTRIIPVSEFRSQYCRDFLLVSDLYFGIFRVSYWSRRKDFYMKINVWCEIMFSYIEGHAAHLMYVIFTAHQKSHRWVTDLIGRFGVWGDWGLGFRFSHQRNATGCYFTLVFLFCDNVVLPRLIQTIHESREVLYILL